MIQANEIRLGNYFYYENKIVEIEKINQHGVNERNVYSYVERNDEPLSTERIIIKTPISFFELQPIPLTHEILKNAGFTYETLEDAYLVVIENENYPLKLFIRLTNATNILFIKAFNNIIIYSTGNIYFHNLQNLYFPFSNKELHINLTNN